MELLLGAAVGLVLLAALTPIRAEVSASAGELEAWARVQAGWGPVMIRGGTDVEARVFLAGRGFRLPPRAARRPTAPKVKAARALAGLGRRDLRVGARMLRRGVRALRLRLELSGTLGLDDPADTATLVAVGWLLDDASSMRIDLQDGLLEDTTQLFARASMRAIPARLALIGLSWLARSDTRRFLRDLR